MELGVDGAVDVVSLKARVRVAEGCRGGHGPVAAAHALATVSAAIVFAATPVVSAVKRLLCLSLATSSRRPDAHGWSQARVRLPTRSPRQLRQPRHGCM
jgi:hypothetical protein